MEYNDLSNERAKALLDSEFPLSDIFKDFEKIEGDHMDIIRSCIEDRADRNLERQKAKNRHLEQLRNQVSNAE